MEGLGAIEVLRNVLNGVRGFPGMLQAGGFTTFLGVSGTLRRSFEDYECRFREFFFSGILQGISGSSKGVQGYSRVFKGFRVVFEAFQSF